MTETQVDMAKLAERILFYGRRLRELDVLGAKIKADVLVLAKTQTVGNVRATYSAGRKTYDYDFAGKAARAVGAISEAIVAQYTMRKIDWRSVCQAAQLEDVPYTQSEPSVTIKLLN